jgi:Protein of unknown function (DUF3160)
LGYLQDTARRELITRTLTDEEYRRLADYGSLVDEITQLAAAGPEGQMFTAGYDEAVAVTVATHGAGEAVESLVEATGQVDTIYVVIERGAGRHLVQGGVYSHYQFRWLGPEQLTDERWREMLDADTMPVLPLWVQGIVVR